MLRRSLILNILLVLLLIAGLGYAFFNSLNLLTNHGEEISVPKLTGENLNAVLKDLKNKKFKVEIDSTYKSYIDPLQILTQEPEAGEMVKVGRTLFLIVNRAEPPKVDMPDLVSKSFRNAVLILKSYRFVMGDTIYRPDIAAGAVLEQLYNGKKVAAGAQIPYGSRIDLVVGEGLADYEVDVPNLIGKTWRDAKEIIAAAGLFNLVVFDGEITDTMNAIVYKQYPEALNELDFPNAIRGGDMIDVQVMQDPSPQTLRKNAPGSLKFQDLDDSLAQVIQNRLDNANTSLKKAKKAEPAENGITTDLDEAAFDEGAAPKRRKVNSRGKGLNAVADDKKKSSNTKAAPVVEDDNSQDFSDDYE